jgi:hypothetical protein
MAACGIAPEDDDGNAGGEAKRKAGNSSPEPQQDMSPKARAQRIAAGVAAGDAEGAAHAMAGWEDALRDSVWNLLTPAVQKKLEAVWPAAEPA